VQEGLAKCYAGANPDAKQKVVHDAIQSSRLTVGEGPFHGDHETLVKSIHRFAGRHLLADKTAEPIDTVLATFLALSFCDLSTAQDQDVLASQFSSRCTDLQSQVDAMLSKRGLASLVPPRRSCRRRPFSAYPHIPASCVNTKGPDADSVW
jgi:hypothetical protein